MQAAIARCSMSELNRLGVDLSESRVLELGAGKGGYSRVLADACKSFVASDIVKEPAFDEQLSDLTWQLVDVARRFPFGDRTFDFIYCSSLVEHVPDPASMLSEARRVLSASGSMLLSFPPFWSLSMVGGHDFKPFHFLGERAAVRVASARQGRPIESYSTAYGKRGGLFRLRIRDVDRLLRGSGFKITARYTRCNRVNTSAWPGILGDFFTWHACFLASPERLGE